MKVGHRQDPIKESPIRKSRAFLRLSCQLSTQVRIHPIHSPGRLGRAERNPTRVSESGVRMTSAMNIFELLGCLVTERRALCWVSLSNIPLNIDLI